MRQSGDTVERFSRSTEFIMDSFITSLVEAVARLKMVSFVTKLLNNYLFDTEGLTEAMADVMCKDPCSALQYYTTAGYISLKERIVERCIRVLGFDAIRERINDQWILNVLQPYGQDIPGPEQYDDDKEPRVTIQAYLLYSPDFRNMDARPENADLSQLSAAMGNGTKLFYSILTTRIRPTPTTLTTLEGESPRLLASPDACLWRMTPMASSGTGARWTGPLSLDPGEYSVHRLLLKDDFPGIRVGWMVVPE